MSIDARVDYVVMNEDGSGELRLIDRPGKPPGIAGQKVLHFETAPHEVTALNGLDIWGGDSSIILGRESKIAKRTGWTTIAFVPRDEFLSAVKAYHERRRELATA